MGGGDVGRGRATRVGDTTTLHRPARRISAACSLGVVVAPQTAEHLKEWRVEKRGRFDSICLFGIRFIYFKVSIVHRCPVLDQTLIRIERGSW
jgi:hypothetical protein